MIRFFPMPYPNESIYSMFVRYDKKIGNNNYYLTAEDLMGNMHSKINFSFCNNLEYLCNEFPKGTIYVPEYFINNHTVLPIYKSFLPEHRYENAINNFKYGSVASALSTIGYTAGSLFGTSVLKYCPECIKEDKNNEVAYIRRTHQIDGNLVCREHKSLLQVYDASEIANNILYDINKINSNNSKNNISNEIIEVLYNLSCDIDSLICKYEHLPNYNITREKYYSKIADLGYISKGGLVNQIKLYNDFINYFPKGLLEILKSNVDINSERSWLRIITRKNEITVHPIRNLLFIRFLFGDFNNFINYSEYKTLCTKEIRCKSNLQVKSEKNIKYDINLEEPYKKKLLSLLNEDANISIKEISKRLRKEYIWLSKYEMDWLESVSPIPLKYKDFYKNDRVNWNERDLKYSIEVKEAIDNILINNVLDRINIHQISKKISYKSLYRSLDKLPKTKAIIDYYTESIQEFHERKIRIVLEKLIRYNKEITPYMILRKAVISYKYYHDYDEFINKLLNSYNN